MPPIEIETERLMPLKALPDYLASRGFGKRVSMRTVNRWVRQGSHGVRLEAITVDRSTFTSIEAVQRWVDAQTAATGGATTPASPAVTASVAGPDSAEHLTSVHLLTEHRVMPTELDRLVHSLDFSESTRGYAAGMLFRAGLRTPDDARRMGIEGLLGIRRLGAKSKSVVHSLWAALNTTP